MNGKALMMAKNFERNLNSLQHRMDVHRSIDTTSTNLTGAEMGKNDDHFLTNTSGRMTAAVAAMR